MKHGEVLESISESIKELQDTTKVQGFIGVALKQNVSPRDIIENGIRKGLEKVGVAYEKGEYYLAELLYAAELIGDGFKLLTPYLQKDKMKKKGTIVVGTVQGDIHDIGKNIFRMLAEAEGFEVIDLGVDVEASKFAQGIKESTADIVAISALLTTTMGEMKTIVDKINEIGIRGRVKILIGGNPINKEYAKEIGADDAGLTAVEGIEICKRWIA